MTFWGFILFLIIFCIAYWKLLDWRDEEKMRQYDEREKLKEEIKKELS
jgi:hypothetical protein